MHKKSCFTVGFGACLLLLALSGGSLSGSVINLMIDADFPSSSSPEATDLASYRLIKNLTSEIDLRGLNATVFLTNETAASPDLRLKVTELGANPRHELAIKASQKNLSSMPYPDQEATIKRAKMNVDACHICVGNVGANVIDAKGFRSLSAGGNDTYKALEEVGIAYDAGFFAGLLYLPGHENDTWPYPVESYSLYAVPVSTAELDGIRVPLYDRYIREDRSLNASQWYELLVSKLNDSALKGQPMVVIFSNQASGSGEYLDVYKGFIKYGASKNATFVTTLELVKMTKVEGHPPVAVSTDVSDCAGCDRMKNETSIKA